MAYCGKCGTKVDDGVKFCPACGASMTAGAPMSAQEQPNQNAQTDFTAKIAGLNNAADNTADFDKADIEQNKVMAILAYLSWLVLIPIFAAPKSKFARYHANQGLVLAIVEIIWWIVEGVLSSIFYAITWGLGAAVSIILGLVNIVFVVMLVIGIMNAANGRAKELPIIGKFKILK